MKSTLANRIHPNRETIDETLEKWQNSNESIVFTNGVFDLVHPGHILYLEEAASLGTKLVVGLNSDESVRSLNKGTNRPILDQSSRCTIMAALRCVDLVVVFDESTPIELIKKVHPNVLVKGGDYTIDQIVGAREVIAYGGQVKQLSFIDGHSTTSIEQKIRNSV